MYQILSPSEVGLLAVLFVLPVFADDDDHKKKLAINQVEGELSVMVLGSGGHSCWPCQGQLFDLYQWPFCYAQWR